MGWIFVIVFHTAIVLHIAGCSNDYHIRKFDNSIKEIMLMNIKLDQTLNNLKFLYIYPWKLIVISIFQMKFF